MDHRIRSLVERILQRVESLAAPLAAAWQAVPGNRRRRVGLLAAGGSLVLLVVIAIVVRPGASGPAAAAPSTGAWSYLVVCDACGHRRRMQGPPATHQVQVCEVCGKGRLTGYRRGSQALIPGGWSASAPAATTRPSEDGS